MAPAVPDRLARMNFSARVWGDALRRLQNDIPDFAFETWIAPLEAKVAEDRLVLGCPNSFHRDRIQRHHLPAIETAVSASIADAAPAGSPPPPMPRIEVLSAADYAQAEGVRLEVRPSMRRVPALDRVQVANGPGNTNARSIATLTPIARSSQAHPQAPTEPAEPYKPMLRSISGTSRKRSEAVRNDAAASDPFRRPAGNAARSESGPDFDLDGSPPGRAQSPFSFDRFVVGPCNALAREAALALARRRQTSLNLLFIASRPGMGKTHLARATAEEARRQVPVSRFDPRDPRQSRPPRAPASEATANGRVLYTTAEQFTSEFVSAMRNGRNDAWARRYRGPIELLVVEDVQSLSGRMKTQHELVQTISHVLDAGGRVLLTGDRAPRDLTGLDERLRAIAGRGFIAELDRPDPLVRRHLFREKAAAAGIHLPSECLDLLVEATEAESLGNSVVDLESLLVQVIMTASLESREIDTVLCREAIALKSGAGAVSAPRQVEVHEIVKAVATFFGARPETLASRSRRRDVLVPRQLAMYLAHRYTDASLTEIGRALGRDHPAVKNAIKKVEEQALKNAPLRYQVEALSERIDALLEASASSD